MPQNRTIDQILKHMQKRLQKTIIVQTPPIPLYWNASIGPDLIVGRHWFSCAGRITRIGISIVGEVKKDEPAKIRFEFYNQGEGRFIEHTVRQKEVIAPVDIEVQDFDHLIVRVNSEAFIAIEISALFIPATNVLATAKAFYDEVERMDDEGIRDTFARTSEDGFEAGEQKPIELPGTPQLSEPPADGERLEADTRDKHSDGF